MSRDKMVGREFNFNMFWSYQVIREGNKAILTPIIMNVVAFIPFGFLLGCSLRRIKWWQMVLSCVCLSAFTEITQFVFRRGFSEIDDVFHNVLGGVIGFGMYRLFSALVKRMIC